MYKTRLHIDGSSYLPESRTDGRTDGWMYRARSQRRYRRGLLAVQLLAGVQEERLSADMERDSQFRERSVSAVTVSSARGPPITDGRNIYIHQSHAYPQHQLRYGAGAGQRRRHPRAVPEKTHVGDEQRHLDHDAEPDCDLDRVGEEDLVGGWIGG